MLSPSETVWSCLGLYAENFITAATAEFIADFEGLFRKSACLKYVFVILMWTFALRIPAIAPMFIVSFRQEPGILLMALIEIIISIGFLVLRDE